jgi:hypothetical protein
MLARTRCAIFTLLLSACGGQTDLQFDESGQSSDQLVSEKPSLIASMTMENGNTVEFHDLYPNVLIIELGEAYNSRATDQIPREMASRENMVEIWDILSKESLDPRPAPDSLVGAQNQSTDTTDSEALHETSDDTISEFSSDMGIAPEGGRAPVGCNNGCCDYDWLSTFSQCSNANNYPFHWAFYSAGWSYANRTHNWRYEGMVCSAIGTSTWTVSKDGSPLTWYVPEAHYVTYFWVAGHSGWPFYSWYYKDITSSVNSVPSPHMHTYCGGMV